MTEISIVRDNLIRQEGYTPYCGNNISRFEKGGCNNPRMNWDGNQNQFVCPNCNYTTEFPKGFIERYKAKWNK